MEEAKLKLYNFERAVFLNARSIRAGGAIAVVGTLTTLLQSVGAEEIVQTDAGIHEMYVNMTAQINNISQAVQTGASDTVIKLYAELISSIPDLHASVAQTIGYEVGRGHDPTAIAALADASMRALSILGIS